MNVVLTRFLISIFLIIPFIRISKNNLTLHKKDIIFGGTTYFLTTILFMSSIDYIGAGLSVILAYIFPIYIFIYSIIIGELDFNFKTVTLILISILGLILLSFDKLGSSNNLFGIFLAILSGIVYAFYIILNKKSDPKKNQIDSIFYQLIGASVLAFAILPVCEIKVNLNPTFILNIFGLAIIGTLSAIYFLIKGMEKIGAFKASIVSLTEPIFAIIISISILNETITMIQIYGLILVLMSCFFSTTIKNNLTQKVT